MGNVNQDPILFNDTIFNNIAFGVESATREEVERAARIANAHEFIMQTEKDTTPVSGTAGQVKRWTTPTLEHRPGRVENPPIMILTRRPLRWTPSLKSSCRRPSII